MKIWNTGSDMFIITV